MAPFDAGHEKTALIKSGVMLPQLKDLAKAIEIVRHASELPSLDPNKRAHLLAFIEELEKDIQRLESKKEK